MRRWLVEMNPHCVFSFRLRRVILSVVVLVVPAILCSRPVLGQPPPGVSRSGSSDGSPGDVRGRFPDRVTEGILSQYDFGRVSGDTIPDVGGGIPPVPLVVQTPTKIRFREGHVRLRKGAKLVASRADSRRLGDAILASQAMTIEIWMRTSDWKQTGPARLVTLSKDSSHRNWTLGHDGNAFEMRLRREGSSSNGLPGTRASGVARSNDWVHLVFTRGSDRRAKLYVNGEVAATSRHSGKLRQWDPACRLVVGDEWTGRRGWSGDLAWLAVFQRALTPAEVRQNFRAGTESSLTNSPQNTTSFPRIGPETSKSPSEQTFVHTIAPLLSRHCLECHDASSREGGLDLSHREAAFSGGDSGPAIAPGSADESLIWTSVEQDHMPHDREPLSANQKSALKDWINQGAAWPVEFVDPAIYRLPINHDRWARRLTFDEYVETIRSLFDVDIRPDAQVCLPKEVRADGFANTAYNLNVDLEHIEAYAMLAEKVVARIDVNQFVAPFAVDRTHTDRNWRPLVKSMGARVLRGDLDDDELALYRGIASTAAAAGEDFEQTVGFVLQTMLQSPRFLYRIEDRAMNGRNRLTFAQRNPFQTACRISYAIVGGPPDSVLHQRATEGTLDDRESVSTQIERLWQDPRCIDRSVDFVSQWLNLDRLGDLTPDRKRFPDWTAELANDMKRETEETFRELVWNRRRPLAELINVPYTFASPRLAQHYRMPPRSEPWTRYDLADDPTRGGILTHGSVLTMGGDDASMVTRGLFVLRDLLFSEVGDPPPGLDTTPVATQPGLTHRDVATQRIKSQSCGGCHRRFEPLAFALEKYDGLGRYQDFDEHGNALRSDGEVLFPGDAEPTPYRDASEMMDLLASSDRVARCLARKVIQYILGRPLDAADADAVDEIFHLAGGREATYQSLVTQLLLSETLR